MIDDNKLLRDYVESRSQAAFTELVHRHLNLVYSAALRQVGGDTHRAEDVAQVVFVDLARKSRELVSHPALSAWLYTSTHFAAATMVRTERRRQNRDQEAYAMNDILAGSAPEIDWDQLRPVLDGAMHDLDERERTAVVLRFFEQRPMTEVGERLRLTESGARKSVDRALENLRGLLVKRGINSTPAALALALGNQTVMAAPTGLAANINLSAAAIGPASGNSTAALFQLMSMTKLGVGIAVLIVAFGVGAYVNELARKQPSSPPIPSVPVVVAAPTPAPMAMPAPIAPVSPEVARARDLTNMIRNGLLDGFSLGPTGGRAGTRDQRAARTVTPVAEMLALSPTDKDRFLQILEDARKSIFSVLAAGGTLTRTSEDEVVINLKEASIEAKAIASNMDDAIKDFLGSDGYLVYEKIAKDSVAETFKSFGVGVATVTITRVGEKQFMIIYLTPEEEAKRMALAQSDAQTNLALTAKDNLPAGLFYPPDSAAAKQRALGQSARRIDPRILAIGTSVPEDLIGPLASLLPDDFRK